jgi:hypothetical protein
MENYICRHCNVNLDNGDIYEHFFLIYIDHKKALETATRYGWSETNKIHFNKSIIVQPDNAAQYVICPFCKNKYPFKCCEYTASVNLDR